MRDNSFLIALAVAALAVILAIAGIVLPDSLPYENLTDVPFGVQSYSFMIGVFSNGTYYAVNGSSGFIISSWNSLDACAVFNSSYSAMPYGGRVFVKNGIYIFRTAPAVVQYSFTETIGESLYVQLFLAGNLNADMFKVGYLANVRFSNLLLNGNWTNNSVGSGIHLVKSYDVVIDRCKITDWKEHCIYVDGSLGSGWDIKILNNQLEFSSLACLNIYAYYESVIIGQNDFTSSSREFIRIYGSVQDISIVGNDFHTTLSASYPAISLTNNIQRCTITSNFFYNLLGIGINIYGETNPCRDITVTANTFNMTGRQAIATNNVYHLSITANAFKDCAIVPNNARPVIELWVANETVVLSNVFDSTSSVKPSVCVSELSPSDWNLIGMNDFNGYVGSAVLTTGVNTKAGGFYNTSTSWITSP